MKLTKRIIVMFLIVLSVLLETNNVNAALQSSGGTPAKYVANNWIIPIRQMESIGGGFGLSETINTNLTPSSGSNNIDIHMEKNTEYGAMAILSASSYGNPSKITSGKTTTGNETGIVINLSGEWISAGTQYTTIFKSIHNKYKNIYSGNTTKKGDATTETNGWHGTSGNVWWNYNEPTAGMVRGINGIFSYISGRGTTTGYDLGYVGQKYATRCVVIVGEGI